MTTPRLFVHTSTQPIRWGDMDAFGHVNNTVYFRYMEQARIEWFHAQAKAGGYTGDVVPMIVYASCNFLAPLVYPGDVEVRMYLGQPGRTSVGSYFEIFAAGKKYADGTAKMVWVDLASGRPIPLPEPIAAPLRALSE